MIRKNFALALALMMIATTLGCAQSAEETPPTELTWKTIEDAIQSAEKNGKKVMIYAYADWCGWCRKLENETLADPEVMAYLTKNFETVRINIESPNPMEFENEVYTEAQMASGLGVRGVPATVFLTTQGPKNYGGFHPKDEYFGALRFVAEDAYLSQTLAEFMQKYNTERQVGSGM